MPTRDSYSELKPAYREVIVGESIAFGATITTGSESSANLLLTNGTLTRLGENTKLVLTALYQKSFKGTNQKAGDLKKEVSPSRIVLNLETGNLVVEARKLSKQSSILISTKVAHAGIRGTQFKVSASADSAELSVLEGRVDFLDAKQLATVVETEMKATAKKGGAANLADMSDAEQAEVRQTVEQTKQAIAHIDLNRLANTVDGYAPKPNYVVKSALNMELIWCPPGSFIMGGEITAHPVILTQGFYLGKYEVTQGEYEKVMGTNPSKFKGGSLPVEKVSWYNTVAFCEALSKKERVPGKLKFTLPSEAQWEYACRAGTQTLFSWGEVKTTPMLANYDESGLKKTQQVGSYQPNPWGFYDMHGNVQELCLDSEGPYPQDLAVDPLFLSAGDKICFRGGAFTNGFLVLRSNRRGFVEKNQSNSLQGFRLCLAPAR